MAREERVCVVCDSGEVEDAGHWLIKCEAWGAQRVPLEDWMEWNTVSTQGPAASLLSVACTNTNYWKLFHICGMQDLVDPLLL